MVNRGGSAPPARLARAVAAWFAVGLVGAGFAADPNGATPPIVVPGKTLSAPPSDAVVLFDGGDLSAWRGAERWTVVDGAAVVGDAFLTSKRRFGDCQVHVEWSAPTTLRGEGTKRGNSGVFLMGRYELQVLDSYRNPTLPVRQAGAVYKQAAPLVNATRPPGEWNVFDIVWTAPRWRDDGSVASPARVTLLHNGVLVLHDFPLRGRTRHLGEPVYEPHDARMPISLQSHGSPVRYRNIWVREL